MEAPVALPMNLTGHSSNPGLPDHAPLFYTSDMVLFTVTERVEAVVDGARPGKNGRLFIVEPGKPIKVPWEAGRFILEHLAYTGVVRVAEIEKKDEDDNVIGISYDVEAAKANSLAKCAEADELRFRQYVADCMQDFIARPDGKTKVPPPPPPPLLRIIERRGYKLDDYGIKPLGYKDPNMEHRQKLEAENADIKAKFDSLQAQMTALINAQNVKNAKENTDGQNAEDEDTGAGSGAAGTGSNQQGTRRRSPGPGNRSSRT